MLFRVWYLQSQSNKNTPCRTVRIFTRTVRTFIAVFVLSVSTLFEKFDSVWQGLPFLQPPSPHIFVALCQKRPLSSTSNYRRLGFVCELCIGTSISKSPGLKVDNPPPTVFLPPPFVIHLFLPPGAAWRCPVKDLQALWCFALYQGPSGLHTPGEDAGELRRSSSRSWKCVFPLALILVSIASLCPIFFFFYWTGVKWQSQGCANL